MLFAVSTCSLKNIRYKLVLLYILNVLDLAFTIVLINTGLFSEVNILVDTLMQSALSCFLVKAILPGVLIAFIIKRIKKASDIQLRISNLLINIVLCFYLAVNLHHLIWLMLTFL